MRSFFIRLVLALIVLLCCSRLTSAHYVEFKQNNHKGDGVEVALTTITHYKYNDIQKVLLRRHNQLGTKSWRSTYTVRDLLYSEGYEICILKKKVTVKELASVGKPIIVSIKLNEDANHLIACHSGNYIDRKDYGNSEVDYFFCKYTQLKSFNKYIDYVWWYKGERKKKTR